MTARDSVNGSKGVAHRPEVISGKVTKRELAVIDEAVAQVLLPRSEVVRLGALMYANRILSGSDGTLLEAVEHPDGLLVRPVRGVAQRVRRRDDV